MNHLHKALILLIFLLGVAQLWTVYNMAPILKRSSNCTNSVEIVYEFELSPESLMGLVNKIEDKCKDLLPFGCVEVIEFRKNTTDYVCDSYFYGERLQRSYDGE